MIVIFHVWEILRMKVYSVYMVGPKSGSSPSVLIFYPAQPTKGLAVMTLMTAVWVIMKYWCRPRADDTNHFNWCNIPE